VPWTAIATIASVVAAGAAAWQLWRLRVDALDARAAEVASVSLSTLVAIRPTPGEVRNGRADWVFKYTIHNPGRLPISEVIARITFPCEVQRRHYDDTLDDPTRVLKLSVPTIPPHSAHPARTRRLSIAKADWHDLDKTSVRIAFWVPDAGECVNEWPPVRGKLSRSLRRRLARRR